MKKLSKAVFPIMATIWAVTSLALEDITMYQFSILIMLVLIYLQLLILDCD